MLKYLYVKEIFREVPDEISLGISLSNCPIRCKDCNQKELWEDEGKEFTWESLYNLIHNHGGITCVCLLGGESSLQELIELFQKIKENTELKTAWYTGLSTPPINILKYLDYIKLGPYIKSLGGLDNPDTNQVLWTVVSGKLDKDITYKLQRK